MKPKNVTAARLKRIAERRAGYPHIEEQLSGPSGVDAVTRAVIFLCLHFEPAKMFNPRTTDFRVLCEQANPGTYIAKGHMLAAYDLLGIPVRLEPPPRSSSPWAYSHYYTAKVRRKRPV
jgi:hypothetical protein